LPTTAGTEITTADLESLIFCNFPKGIVIRYYARNIRTLHESWFTVTAHASGSKQAPKIHSVSTTQFFIDDSPEKVLVIYKDVDTIIY